jgi:hypothetical protein
MIPQGSLVSKARWLLIARVGWVAVTLLIVILNVAMLPSYDAILQAHCQAGSQCFAIQLTPYDRQLLHQLGLTTGFLAAYQVMLDATSVLICCALGTLIFWRKSTDRMALFCAFMLVLFGGAGFTSILQDTLGPLSPAWFALVGTLDALGQTGFLIFFLLFPNGRFVPRWTIWLALCTILYWIISIFIASSLYSQWVWSNFVFFALLLCIVGAQVYRYRRVSTSRERQQTKWVVFGFSMGIVGFVLFISAGNAFLRPALLNSSVLTILVSGTCTYSFILLTPISIAIAILRSRLYDIDILINRTLVYGLLTGLLVAIYAGLTIGLESLVGLIAGQASQPVIIVISTLAIAALFQPLRRRIQSLIDRRFYRRKYDAQKILTTFGTTLSSEINLEQLSEQVLLVVSETMQPAHASLWLRVPQQQNYETIP